MNIRMPSIPVLWFALIACVPFALAAEQPPTEGYTARQESLRGFFEALAAPLGKPIIVSKLAGQKKITGDFGLGDPERTLARLASRLGLIWYDDGQALYVYDASESKSAVGSLNTITVEKLRAFLLRSGLVSIRYPLRSDGARTFYVSGPPIYVDLVMQAATLMDTQASDLQLGQQRIGVIRLRNTFVGDRSYPLRDETVVVPGMATVIEQLLAKEESPVLPGVRGAREPGRPGGMPAFPSDSAPRALEGVPSDSPVVIARDLAAGNIRVIAYPDTNSLLVKGLPEQVRFIENLVAALDESKRHVELSLWIIDLQKEDLDQLGVTWQGASRSGARFSASFNGGSATTLDGATFVAQVLALERRHRANVVSRPVLLTQENVPAVFDNNRTFYASLVGERAVDLQHVTYGTMVNVLPRFAIADEIEMLLSIEDGNEVPRDDGAENRDGNLPTVGRTRISTVARVPPGKSLLVGGFTRDESGEQIGRIPVLGSLPYIGRLFSYRATRVANTVRVFLIQPREIVSPLAPGAADLAARASDFGMQQRIRQDLLRAIEH